MIIHPSWHRGPPATRVHWRPEGALAGVVEQQPQSAVQKLGRTRLRRGTMLVEERAALLTQLVVRRMRLSDSGGEEDLECFWSTHTVHEVTQF